MNDTSALMLRAHSTATVLPAFNIPYLPMIEPVVAAFRACNAFGLIEVARLEWIKFQSGSLSAVKKEYDKHSDRRHTRLHLDHVPVIDEDNKLVDYLSIIREAVSLGYDSVMVDGSRLSLEENIAASREVAELAHAAGVPVEAELGAISGHESGPAMDYETLFASRKGFTDIEEATRFVRESGVDWLSVAFGNIHGPISLDRRNAKKVAARLDIEHLKRLSLATNLPLVLHGGSGIAHEYIRQAVNAGICKINIAIAIRQAYEQGIAISEIQARQNVYDVCCNSITNELNIANNANLILTDSQG